MKFGKHIKSDLRFIAQALTNWDKKRCLYVGWTGRANLGDEALKEAIFELFSSDVVFAESRGAIVRIFERLRLIRFDILMLGGGTLILRSNFTLETIIHSSISKKVVFGTGVANHSFWKDVPDTYGEFSGWKKFLETVDYLGVRGPVSRQSLQNLGLKRDIPIIGDPVLYFTRPIVSNKGKRRRLGVNIGTTKNSRFGDLLWGRNESAFIEKFSEFLRVMLADDWDIEFIPVYPKDLQVIESAIEKSGGRGRISVFKDYDSVEKTLNRMEQYDVFIGQKLHSVILAYCANTPAVMVEYRPKCRDFMESIEMSKFNLRTDEFNVEKAKILIQELYENVEDYRLENNKRCLEFKSKLKSSVKDTLESVVYQNAAKS